MKNIPINSKKGGKMSSIDSVENTNFLMGDTPFLIDETNPVINIDSFYEKEKEYVDKSKNLKKLYPHNHTQSVFIIEPGLVKKTENKACQFAFEKPCLDSPFWVIWQITYDSCFQTESSKNLKDFSIRPICVTKELMEGKLLRVINNIFHNIHTILPDIAECRDIIEGLSKEDLILFIDRPNDFDILANSDRISNYLFTYQGENEQYKHRVTVSFDKERGEAVAISQPKLAYSTKS